MALYKACILHNLYTNIEREKYMREEIEKLRGQDFRLREARALGVTHLSVRKPYQKQQRKTKIDCLLEEYRNLKKKQYEYLAEFGIKEDIYVYGIGDKQVVIFLKKAGWAGSAIIFREDFVSELTENHIPVIHSTNIDWWYNLITN